MTDNIFPNKAAAMAAGERARRGYTVEPVAERDPAKPWRLTVDPAPAEKAK